MKGLINMTKAKEFYFKLMAALMLLASCANAGACLMLIGLAFVSSDILMTIACATLAVLMGISAVVLKNMYDIGRYE